MLFKMRKIIFIFVTIWVSFNSVYSQTSKLELREEVRVIVDSIAIENTLMGSAIGYAGIKPDQYKRFEKLKSIASQNELIGLTEHKNPTVRCYAFWALAESDFRTYDIIKAHIQDKDYVRTSFGCTRSSTTVGDFFLSFSDFTESQQHEVDSILLYDDKAYSYATNQLLLTIEPIESYYNRIREIALKTKN